MVIFKQNLLTDAYRWLATHQTDFDLHQHDDTTATTRYYYFFFCMVSYAPKNDYLHGKRNRVELLDCEGKTRSLQQISTKTLSKSYLQKHLKRYKYYYYYYYYYYYDYHYYYAPKK